MQHINAKSLDSLLIEWLISRLLLNFTADDAAALHTSKDVVAPLIPAVLDAVCTKLLSFDITAASFVPRNTAHEGQTPQNVQELTLQHPQIVFWKDSRVI